MAAAPRRRRFEAEDVDGVTVVRLSDPILDEENGAQLGEQIFRLAEGSERKQVRLDLAGVRFVSSAALGALIALNRKVQAIGGKLSLCNLNQEMKEVIRATKLDTVFDIEGL